MMQGDGNLVLYEGPTPRWASSTVGTGANFAAMQSDGNLVLYAGNAPVWASNTFGSPGAYLAIQEDGNLVIYTAPGTPDARPIWSSMNPGPSTECGVMRTNQGLSMGRSITSCDGRFVLTMQLDGNLVLSQNGVGPIWSSGTFGRGNLVIAAMQPDGNFVLQNRATNPPTPIWATGTSNSPGARIVVQNDGNLVIYNAGGAPVWASNTCCR
jgi:hypothetical protein